MTARSSRSGSSFQVPQTLWIGRHRLRFSMTGEGPPVLLVNGLGGGLEMWDPVVRMVVASGRRTITYDNPGIGDSSTPFRLQSVAALARVAERLLDGLGIAAADVLGYSLGGFIAQRLAYQAPDRVRRLILAATTSGWGSPPPSPMVLAQLALPLRFYSATVYRFTLPTLVGGRARRDPVVVSEFLSAHRHPVTLRTFMYQLYAGGTYVGSPWLGRIHHPTLVVVGDDDPLIPVSGARKLAALIPNAELLVVPGAGHLVLLEVPADALGPIIDFLEAPAVDPTDQQ